MNLFKILSSYKGFIFKLFYFETWYLIRSIKYREFSLSFDKPSLFEEYKDSVEYVPTPYYFLREALNFIDYSNGSIIDIGCGSGRALRYFKEYTKSHNIHEFIGIDLNTQVLDVGRKFNDEIKYINNDATIYEFPQDTIFIYLFNPFGQSSMSNFIDNLVSQKNKFKSKVRIIYVSPVHMDLFEKDFRLIFKNINEFNKGIAVFDMQLNS